MDDILTIKSASYVGDYSIVAEFSNGETRLLDFSELVTSGRGMLKMLADKEYFRHFTLDPFTIDWNNEIGFEPEYLYAMSKPLPKYYADNVVFNDNILYRCTANHTSGSFNTDLSDGYLNLCSLDNVKKIELISFLLNVIKEEHYGKKHVHNSKIKNLKVTSNVEILCGVDGECIRSNEFNFKVCPNAIRYYNHDDYDIKRLIVSK